MVLTSFPGSDFIEIAPSDGTVTSKRILYVSFWAEVSTAIGLQPWVLSRLRGL